MYSCNQRFWQFDGLWLNKWKKTGWLTSTCRCWMTNFAHLPYFLFLAVSFSFKWGFPFPCTYMRKCRLGQILVASTKHLSTMDQYDFDSAARVRHEQHLPSWRVNVTFFGHVYICWWISVQVHISGLYVMAVPGSVYFSRRCNFRHWFLFTKSRNGNRETFFCPLFIGRQRNFFFWKGPSCTKGGPWRSSKAPVLAAYAVDEWCRHSIGHQRALIPTKTREW